MNLFIYFLMSMLPYAATGKKDHVSLLFVGDISFSGPVKYYVERKHHTYNDTFNEVAPYIRQADISIGNLECPFVDKDVYPHKFKDRRRLIILDSSPKAASALSFAGFNAVTVANNHFNDFGSEGANFTVDVLRKEGIKYFGITYGEYNSSQILVYCSSSRFVGNSGTGNAFTDHLVCKTMTCEGNSLEHNKGQAVLKSERKQSTSGVHKSLILVA